MDVIFGHFQDDRYKPPYIECLRQIRRRCHPMRIMNTSWARPSINIDSGPLPDAGYDGLNGHACPISNTCPFLLHARCQWRQERFRVHQVLMSLPRDTSFVSTTLAKLSKSHCGPRSYDPCLFQIPDIVIRNFVIPCLGPMV